MLAKLGDLVEFKNINRIELECPQCGHKPVSYVLANLPTLPECMQITQWNCNNCHSCAKFLPRKRKRPFLELI